MRERYDRAEKTAKGRLLDEVCEVTGYHPESGDPSAAPAGGPAGAPPRPPRSVWADRRRPPAADLEIGGLSLVAPVARAAAGMAAVGHAALEDFEGRRGETADDEPAPDGPLLQPFKKAIRKRQYGRTKPGTLLKHQIPLKTDRWDVQVPGFTEVDLVAHSGDRADGDVLHSLNVSDIHTTWVETRAVIGKSQLHVQTALEHLRQQLPFRLQGIDSDNGSEFINKHLHRYCTAQQIQFTRGRPYKKDDNAHIEQKNWTHVRKLLGYVRYDSAAALAAINALYDDLRLMQNLYLPSVKLIEKRRVGTRIRRRHDAPRTPLARVASCAEVHRERLHAWQQLQRQLDPIALAQRIDDQLAQINGDPQLLPQIVCGVGLTLRRCACTANAIANPSGPPIGVRPRPREEATGGAATSSTRSC
jgi:hypothetical protein